MCYLSFKGTENFALYQESGMRKYHLYRGGYYCYGHFSEQLRDRTPCEEDKKEGDVMGLDLLWAFLIGGAICVVGQLLIDFTKLTPGKILVTFVIVGVFLGAVGVYKPLVEFAGCGATVPLTGFGYSLAEGTKKAIAEDGALGIVTGGLTATSAGITLAVVLGFILSVIAKPKDKS